MEELSLTYLKLLEELRGSLDQLSQLAQEKAAAVRASDLTALSEVLKQEQALSLNLRGLELRRQKLAPQLGLDGMKLSDLPGRCPPQLEEKARKTAEDLRRSYSLYQSYADAARSTLELNLHQIDQFLLDQGVDPKLAAAGYESPSTEPPKNMKTDFRA
ncbi:MAG: flagellar protein FlgN [Oscillospiraceae bacterium]|nr:flagellar protein FlgN [Oscillospiraceae bacterium]